MKKFRIYKEIYYNEYGKAEKEKEKYSIQYLTSFLGISFWKSIKTRFDEQRETTLFDSIDDCLKYINDISIPKIRTQEYTKYLMKEIEI